MNGRSAEFGSSMPRLHNETAPDTVSLSFGEVHSHCCEMDNKCQIETFELWVPQQLPEFFHFLPGDESLEV